MIQFNLLPDVKLAYIRAERQKRIIAVASTVAIIASLVVLAFLVTTVKLIQPKSINDLGKDITTATTKLQSIKDIDKILTVQSQLGALTALHDNKVVADRTANYMYQLTPAAATVSSLMLDYVENSITISGSAPDLMTVNKFVDTLKFTTYRTDESVSTADAPAAFTAVVLSSFAPAGDNDEGATFTITAVFDPAIFSGEYSTLQLVVPNLITTRAQVARPTALFQPAVEGDAAAAQTQEVSTE